MSSYVRPSTKTKPYTKKVSSKQNFDIKIINNKKPTKSHVILLIIV